MSVQESGNTSELAMLVGNRIELPQIALGAEELSAGKGKLSVSTLSLKAPGNSFAKRFQKTHRPSS